MVDENQHFGHIRYAIGASYSIQQTPGGECTGGLQIKLQYPKHNVGTIQIETTTWPSDQVVETVEEWDKIALDVLDSYAKKMSIDLANFDVTLSRFIIRDVDRSPLIYAIAAQNAPHSDLMTW